MQPLKIGILGGGQLGRMLLQTAANYAVETFVLENDENCPSAHLCHHFVKGDLNNYESVLAFGKKVDVLTIEIEHVNLQALYELESAGKTIIPKPSVLEVIKDKGKQKLFYQSNAIPTSPFKIVSGKDDLLKGENTFPFVQKLCTGGYDGKGVVIIDSLQDLPNAFDAPSVIESKVDFEKEVAVIVAVSQQGVVSSFPPVEMVFDPKYNLVDYLISPADLDLETQTNAIEVARNVVSKLNSPGLFAVELFITKDKKVLVNEIAPRVHNSGHQSIEGNVCSQFDMLLRILQSLPLGSTDIKQPAIMLNITGEENHSGLAVYNGLEDVLSLKGVYIHLYGKRETRPGRKMGHITLTASNKKDLLNLHDQIRGKVTVISHDKK